MIDQYLAGEFVSVSSSNIQAIAFQFDYTRPGRGAIGIKYKEGVTWWYEPYSPDEAIDFFNASSKGEWCWNHIKVRGTKNKHQRTARKA